MSLMDWLFGNSSAGGNSGGSPAAQPNLPTNVDVGSAEPQVPGYDAFSQNYRLSNFLSKSGFPGLGALVGPDTSGQAYNAMLEDAQKAKTGQLNVRGWENRGSGAGQARPGMVGQMLDPNAAAPSAPVAPGPPDVQLSPNMTLGGAALPQYTAPTGLVTAMSGNAPPAASGADTSGGLSPQSIMSEIHSLGSFPAGAAMIAPYLKLLETQTSGGRAINGSGGVYRLPGANSADYQTEQSKAMGTGLLGFNADGTIGNLPGVVASAAGKAGAIEGAQKWAGVAPANAITQFNTNEDIRKAFPVAQGTKMGTDLLYRDANGVIQNQPGATNSLGNIQNAKPYSLRPGGFTEFDSQGNIRGQTSAQQTGIAPDGAPTSQWVFPPVKTPTNYLGSPGFPAGSGTLTTPDGPVRPTGLSPGAAEEAKALGKGRGAASEDLDTLARNAPLMRSQVAMAATAVNDANLGSGSDIQARLSNAVATVWKGGDMEKSATANQVFDKVMTQLSGEQTKALDQTAVAALQTFKSANPNREMTKPALMEMFSAIDGGAQYTMAKQAARDAWLADQRQSLQPQSLQGFESDWNSKHTPMEYILPAVSVPTRRAILKHLSTTDLQKLQALGVQ